VKISVEQRKDVSALWADILCVWLSGQVALPQVARWSKYHKENGQKMTRLQNSLQHSYSIPLLGKIVCYKLRPYVSLDEALLQNALLIHDHGEGEILRDTHYIDKNEEGDLEEYLAFVRCYSMLPKNLFEEFNEAFLLQFAMKNPLSFPEEARSLMTFLAIKCKSECLAFDAVERWDYVLYALEQFLVYDNTKILVQTMRHQAPHLDRLTKELPGFGEQIWTTSTRSCFSNLLEDFKYSWIEQKGEK
jgi:hypothetical protein